MCPGMFNGQLQPMAFPDDHPNEALRGKAKGLRIVLTERGLWPESGTYWHGATAAVRTMLSVAALMSLQPDFHAQKSLIAETIEAEGHKRIFYPKFHCELNYIEYFWGAAKHYCRVNCDYT